jgi:hypothetical protein
MHSAPVRHRIYGLHLAANRPIPGLAPSFDSGDEADVLIHFHDSPAFPSAVSESRGSFFYTSSHLDEAGAPTLRVASFADGGYFGLFYQDGPRFAIDRTGRYLVGPVLGFVLRLRGITPLHASAVALDDHAIALVGTPGAGKSTTAAAFAHLGFAVLSDDVVALEDCYDRFLVAPGYPRVNLWPDSVRTLLGSEKALPRITPTWEKHYLPLDEGGRRFQAEKLPLGAVYFLRERDPGSQTPAISQVAAGDALIHLVANTYVNYLLDRPMRHREFDLLSRLVASVPIRELRPSADPSAVLALCEAVAADARQIMNPSLATVALGAR